MPKNGVPEDDSQKKSRIKSMRIVQCLVFVSALGFSSVITALYPYLKELLPNESEQDLIPKVGILVAVNPIASTIIAPLGGFFSAKMGQVRVILVMSVFTNTCSYGLYSLISLANESIRYQLLLVSRFFAGASQGVVYTLARSYISEATLVSERTGEMGIFMAVQGLGFTLGPALQAAFAPIGCSYEAKSGNSYIAIDTYTTCGWCMVFLGLLCFVVLLPNVFVEHKIVELQDETVVLEIKEDGLDFLSLLVLLWDQFVIAFVFTLLEALGTPTCMDNFGWTSQAAVLYFGIIMAVGGIVQIVFFMLVAPASKVFDERKLLIFVGLVGYILCHLFLYPIPGMPSPVMKNSTGSGPSVRVESLVSQRSYFDVSANVNCEEDVGQAGCELEWCNYMPALQIWQIIVGLAFGVVAAAFGNVISGSLYSKKVGHRSQAFFMGILTSVDSFARVIGPVMMGQLYTYYGLYATVSMSIGIMFMALAMTSLTYRRLKIE